MPEIVWEGPDGVLHMDAEELKYSSGAELWKVGGVDAEAFPEQFAIPQHRVYYVTGMASRSREAIVSDGVKPPE